MHRNIQSRHGAGSLCMQQVATYMRQTVRIPTNAVFEIIYTFSQKKSEQSLLRMLMLVFRQCQNRACQLEFGSAINYGINLLIKKKSSRDKMMCTSASKNTSTQIYILVCRNFSAVFFSFCLGLGMQVETGKKELLPVFHNISVHRVYSSSAFLLFSP